MEGQIWASLPAADIERARSWYAEKLGVKPFETGDDGALFYEWGGSRWLVYPSAFAGTNQATAAGLLVPDFDAAVAELRRNGVVFEDYDFGDEFRTVDGILTGPDGFRGAWFQDSEGNIIGVSDNAGT